LKEKLLKLFNMFENFKFSKKQIDRYFKAVIADLRIARNSDEPEVIFRFSYDAFLKICITLSARNNLRIKSRQGHHMALIEKLSELLGNNKINIIGQEMRLRRNKALYGAVIGISNKQAGEYLDWVEKILQQAEIYIKEKEGQEKLL